MWRSLGESIEHLDTPQQLQIIGRTIEHLVELFVTSSEQVFEELDATMTKEGPQMTIEPFLPYVRQGIEIDFSQFMGGFDRESKRDSYAPRMLGTVESQEEGTIVAEVDSATLADAVEGLGSGETDLETAISLSHIEDVEAWASAISAYFEAVEVETVSLQMLQQEIVLPWIEIWLGLLLGGF
ncbi:hypothetical protein ACQ4M3_41605 [Leptolyngbya sp. AN03gr2]|uniref:hypothetical protein n=1 Tax=unclassified Leptolyngbya TaxID=2650499 RepID=UPI003D319A37